MALSPSPTLQRHRAELLPNSSRKASRLAYDNGLTNVFLNRSATDTSRVSNGELAVVDLHSLRSTFLPWTSGFRSRILVLVANLSLCSERSHCHHSSQRKTRNLWGGVTRASATRSLRDLYKGGHGNIFHCFTLSMASYVVAWLPIQRSGHDLMAELSPFFFFQTTPHSLFMELVVWITNANRWF